MLSHQLRTILARPGTAVAVGAVVFGFAAASSQASTIAYVNANNGNTYVASSTGTGVQEVATGVSSPSLANNGNLYALKGNQVNVYAPGTGAQTPIPITGTGATQLAVSPFGGKLAWADGSVFTFSSTTVNQLTRSTGKVTSFANMFAPQWTGSVSPRLVMSHFDASGPVPVAGASVYNGTSTQTVWTAVQQPVSETIVLQYAPNPAHTQAAAAVLTATLRSESVSLVVFPIGRNLGPSGDPLSTGVLCNVGGGDVNPQPTGMTFAWAPDGSAIAWSSNEGIDTASIGSWNSNCSQIGSSQLVIPGGTQPSWGSSNRRNFPTP